ncbi:putative signal transduction protein with CBS domains [Methanocaldococcus infernus ME]|uniref:Signal transduction protein with CBS domains n=1 Tax=Methanocaldococcus infernus (strain DSM 11812 / JCM 15783 / ME) TaxID=573063 RepID=D5VUD1_METIM|nr:CBS domain-containing protein [Methanocaldococcus infernus]ADG12743.1 putative signal transduction protein with CBS domains [Methanocaldococcus infernus ME]
MISKYLVRDVMTKGVVEVPLDTKLEEIVKIMDKYNISSVVVSDGEQFWGIVTDTDILKNYHNLDKTAEEVMTSKVILVTPEAPLEKAIDLMVEHKIHHLYVKSSCEDRIIGVISSRDIIKLFSKLIGGEYV